MGIKSMNSGPLTRGRLAELLIVDPERGLLWWRDRHNRMEAGSPAGSRNGAGYIQVRIDGRIYLAHRLVWMHVHGEFPNGQLDHRSGTRDANGIENLRAATQALNSQNVRGPRKHSSIGLAGVARSKGGYSAKIRANGVRHYLGYFTTPEAAHAAYMVAKRELHPAAVAAFT